VTIYEMELPPNTTYSGDLRHGQPLAIADWPLKRAWHDHAIEALSAAGYEISSAYTMVRKGSGARFVYRDALWHGADMIAAGVSSFGHLSGVHFQNTASWDDYLAETEAGRLPLARGLALTPEERLTREFILQLKLGRLDAGPFRARHGVDVMRHFAPALARLEVEGFAVLSPAGVRLTREGLLRVDHLLPDFYAPPYRQE
jgi:oxygen-independent coproporphyrinogen-3 oxidase